MNIRFLKSVVLLLIITIISFLMCFSAYAGNNDTVFGTNYNLEAFCMAFWPVYPN
jgi:hypothetical protein